MLPKVNIHELVEVNSMYNEQKIANLTGKIGGLVTNPCKITNSAKCINAWLTSNAFQILNISLGRNKVLNLLI